MNNFFDRLLKGPFTSLLGFVLMSMASWGWWIGYLSDWQGGSFGIIGFSLLFMRDKIPGFINDFVKSFTRKFKK